MKKSHYSSLLVTTHYLSIDYPIYKPLISTIDQPQKPPILRCSPPRCRLRQAGHSTEREEKAPPAPEIQDKLHETHETTNFEYEKYEDTRLGWVQ